MRNLLLAAGIIFVAASPAAAVNKFFGVNYDTTAGSATLRVSGSIRISTSSNNYLNNNIILNGRDGSITWGFDSNGSTLTTLGGISLSTPAVLQQPANFRLDHGTATFAGNIHSSNTITANDGFVGNLTGSASLNVLKSGDTMTGQLTVAGSSLTVGGAFDSGGVTTLGPSLYKSTFSATGVLTARGLISDSFSGNATVGITPASGQTARLDFNNNTGSVNALIGVAEVGSNMTFYTNGTTPRMHIDGASGKVGINETNPDSQLEVTSSQGGSSYIVKTSSQNGTALFGVQGNGNVALNTVAYSFPTTDGSSGQVLKTDGGGNLDWVANASAGADVSSYTYITPDSTSATTNFGPCIAGSTVTFTTSNVPLEIFYAGNVAQDSADQVLGWSFLMDGAFVDNLSATLGVATKTVGAGEVSRQQNMSGTYHTQAVSAGSHSFCMTGARSAGTVTWAVSDLSLDSAGQFGVREAH